MSVFQQKFSRYRYLSKSGYPIAFPFSAKVSKHPRPSWWYR